MFTGLKRWFSKPKVVAGNVYYVKFRFGSDEFYKVGFTTKTSVSERFSYANKSDFKNITKVMLFSYQEDAWNIEQDLLDHFKKHLAFGKYSNDPTKPLAGNGQSELFKIDVLGLDEDLYKVPVHLKQEFAEASGWANDGCLLFVFALAAAPFTLGLSLFLLFMGGGILIDSGKTFSKVLKKPEHPQHVEELISRLLTQSTHKETKHD